MDINEEFYVNVSYHNGDMDCDGPFPTYQSATERGIEFASQSEGVNSFTVDKIFKVS